MFDLVGKLKGWKIKGLSVGYVLLVITDKFVLDIGGFEAGENWLNEIIVALGIFAARDTVDTVVDKVAGK